MTANMFQENIALPSKKRETTNKVLTTCKCQYRRQKSTENKYSIQLIILGDVSTGKTSLFNKYISHGCTCTTHREKVTQAKSSVVIKTTDFADRVMEMPGTRIKLRIYDTARQERYRSLTASYYRGAHGCLIVYDVTKLSSFENINYWLSDLKEYTSQPEISAILVGTKCHVPEEDREVTSERAQKFAESVGLPYMEVSAEESINVTEVFEKLADLIIQNLTKHPTVITNVIKPHTETLQQQKAKKKWCSC